LEIFRKFLKNKHKNKRTARRTADDGKFLATLRQQNGIFTA